MIKRNLGIVPELSCYVKNATKYEISDHMAGTLNYILFDLMRGYGKWDKLTDDIYQRKDHSFPGSIDRVVVMQQPRKGPDATDEPALLFIGVNYDNEYADQWETDIFCTDVEEWAILLQWLGW